MNDKLVTNLINEVNYYHNDVSIKLFSLDECIIYKVPYMDK